MASCAPTLSIIIMSSHRPALDYIHIEDQPAVVEGREVTFTARPIQDLNGNNNSPVTWSVLVKQSNPRWILSTVNWVCHIHL